MFIIYNIIAWTLTLLGSVIPSIVVGVMVTSMLGDWAYWPAYVITTIAFFYVMRSALFLNADIDVPPPKERKRTLIPLIIGLLIGLNIGDD